MEVATKIKEPSLSQPEHSRTSDSGAAAFDRLWRDLRFGLRVLARKPGFTVVALITLALGIGANTAIFSVVNAALLTPIPVPFPDRVVVVWTDRLGREASGFPASEPDFVDWQGSGVFEKLAGNITDGYNVLIGDNAVRVLGAAVTQDWFVIGGVKPYLGRLFRPADMQPGQKASVLLTYDFWNARFHADLSIPGRTIILNNLPYTVLGVLPKRLVKIANEEIYVPLIFGAPYNRMREMRLVNTLGRLAPGVTLEAAQRRMEEVSSRLAQQYPREDGGMKVRLQPVEEAYVEDVHTLVVVLFGAVGFVLLVACANMANLLLVRGASRQRELAVRSALGASRSDLMRQLLTESVLLSVCGGLLGIFPAVMGINLLAKYRPEALPNSDLIGLNPTVLLFTLLLATCTGLLFGMIPAWNSWRSTAVSALRERSQTSGNLKFGNLFVIAEVALTVILAVAAGLMLRNFIHLRSAYPGYDSRVISMRVSLTGKQYDAPEEQIKFCRQILDHLRGVAGVRSVAAIDAIPTSGDLQGGMLHFTDRPESPNDQALVVIAPVSPDYFDTMHIPLIRGRAFTQADSEHAGPVLIIDQLTAKKYWPNQDPIGQYVRVRMNTPLRRIVGLVGTVDRNLPLKGTARVGQAYLPYDQFPSSDISLVISSAQEATSGLNSALRREVSALAPDQPIYDLQTLDQARSARQTASRFGTWLLGFFALLSMSLAAIGVYGVIAYSVEQRTREIGVRMALGATQQDLLTSVLKRGLKLLFVGLVIGFCGALALGRIMGNLLHGVSGTDPVAFLGAAGILLLTGLLATFVPAFRASRIDPMIALRQEQ